MGLERQPKTEQTKNCTNNRTGSLVGKAVGRGDRMTNVRFQTQPERQMVMPFSEKKTEGKTTLRAELCLRLTKVEFEVPTGCPSVKV